MKDHSLLVERYRSKTLDEYVGNETIKKTIQQYLDQNDIQNFIFYGPAGTGKTTLAKLIVNNLDCDHIYINASDERGIETFSRTTRFILTCNYVERIIDPLQSRCQVLKIIPPSKQEIARHLNTILINEIGKGWDVNSLVNIINTHYPDIRKMLNTIQLSTKDGKLVVDDSILVANNYIKEILKELKNKNTNFRVLRQIIADSGVKDFEELYRKLFDNASEYAPGREGSVAVILNEHLYQGNFRIDKEINIASALSKLIEIKKPQVI
jgi:replication factor C small subunit